MTNYICKHQEYLSARNCKWDNIIALLIHSKFAIIILRITTQLIFIALILCMFILSRTYCWFKAIDLRNCYCLFYVTLRAYAWSMIRNCSWIKQFITRTIFIYSYQISKQKKYFFGDFQSGKTLRVNKIALKGFLKNLSFVVDF